eukprot:TRINITY_DN2161_c0_g1_i1.p1 TRINITY_DN2161_c0_g1~~TRINITY_DN2161_c0_g1_i1.p1  ORF type:complete len:265 (+),score=54.43 TRINITY_DN2161_c0_g1_i1:79-795(+)
MSSVSVSSSFSSSSSSSSVASSQLTSSELQYWKAVPVLEGKFVRLEPLSIKNHFPALFEAGGKDKVIWRYCRPTGEDVFANSEEMACFYYAGQLTQNWLPWAVVEKKTNKVIGSYTLLDISTQHRAAEIGCVWIASSQRGTIANTESVSLILHYCFEKMKAFRVVWKTDLRNELSQKTALTLGATKEGVLRNHYIMRDGYRRSSCMFSWIDTEWESVSKLLEKRMLLFGSDGKKVKQS